MTGAEQADGLVPRVPIFLPGYSQVRSAMSPAVGTAMTAMISMP